MTPKQIDRYCASLPAATRTVQWEGVVVFKVGGKMFCLIASENHSIGRISFKSAPEHYDALSARRAFGPRPTSRAPSGYRSTIPGADRCAR